MAKSALRMTDQEYEAVKTSIYAKKRPVATLSTHSLVEDIADSKKTPQNAPNGVKRWQALGRLPKGTMNKTEAMWAAKLESAKQSGEILWFKFHPMRIRLADNTFYEVDFLVMTSTGQLEIHEVKGGYTSDKGQLKIKLCAETMPIFRMLKVSKVKSDWKVEDYSAK